ncbi:YopX family protein [Bacillus sp. FJAT-27916]|uniref:YopX family protein n=1 Tax=Bacillus sp. FJAT-27916 TaxID=1679169 RepID=UPI0012E229FD|nr:YopX family protein [Bacillus sp. FJAT-27916]
MRDNKFRVWDTGGKRYWYFTSSEDLDPSLERIIKEGEIQKFSGLNDVNGVDIYEGDFLKVVFDDDEFDEYDEPMGVVKFGEEFRQIEDEPLDGWIISDGTKEGGEYLDQWDGAIEVVGNMYENEELLLTLKSDPSDPKPLELKFRVWDGKKIIYVSKDSGYRLVFEGGDWELEYKNEQYCTSKDPWCKLMQFSGATDINEKDIYEGDIVKNGLNEEEYKRKYPNDYKEYGFTLGEFVGISTYDAECSCWCIDNPKYIGVTMVHHLFCEIDMKTVEVIGNVHENEEIFRGLISE